MKNAERGSAQSMIDYAPISRAGPMVRVVCIRIASLVVGPLTAWAAGALAAAKWSDAEAAARSQAAGGPQAYSEEIRWQIEGGHQVGITSALLVGTSLLLIVAAVQLLRRRNGGLFLHRLYAVLQIGASFAFGMAVYSDVSHSCADMAAMPMGIILGAIGGLYPVVVLLGLIGTGRRWRVA